MMDAGIAHVCCLVDTADPGDSPKMKLEKASKHYFEERIVGFGRQYAAMGVNERVDMLVRVWRDASVRIGMYVLLEDYEGQENEDGDQYRIDNVQHVLDDDGLKVTDLSLYRLDKRYEVIDADA